MDMKDLNNIYLINRSEGYEAFPLLDNACTFNVKKDEDLNLFFLIFNNKINIKVNLMEEGAKCAIKCVYLASQTQQSHISFDVVHVAPDTSSSQLIKGVLTDKAHVTLNGVIRMPRDSQRCVGLQNHRAYLLSDKAQIQATPELEIYADDVQCSHGSAVGPLEKNHLFYLMSRGIDEKTAEKLLLESALIDLIPEEYKNMARSWINEYI